MQAKLFALPLLPHSILTASLWGWCYYYPCLTHKESEGKPWPHSESGSPQHPGSVEPLLSSLRHSVAQRGGQQTRNLDFNLGSTWDYLCQFGRVISSTWRGNLEDSSYSENFWFCEQFSPQNNIKWELALVLEAALNRSLQRSRKMAGRSQQRGALRKGMTPQGLGCKPSRDRSLQGSSDLLSWCIYLKNKNKASKERKEKIINKWDKL